MWSRPSFSTSNGICMFWVLLTSGLTSPTFIAYLMLHIRDLLTVPSVFCTLLAPGLCTCCSFFLEHFSYLLLGPMWPLDHCLGHTSSDVLTLSLPGYLFIYIYIFFFFFFLNAMSSSRSKSKLIWTWFPRASHRTWCPDCLKKWVMSERADACVDGWARMQSPCTGFWYSSWP